MLIAVVGIALTNQFQQNQEQQKARLEAAEKQKAAQEKKDEQEKSQRSQLDHYIQTMTDLINEGSESSLNSVRSSSDSGTAAVSRTVLTLKNLDSALNKDLINFLRLTKLIAVSPFDWARNVEKWNKAVEFEAEYLDLDDEDYDQYLEEYQKPATPPERPLSLSKQDLSSVNFEGVDLSRLNLSRVNLNRAHMANAILFGADLEGANLMGANLMGANLTHANLKDAKVDETTLEETAHLCQTTMPSGDVRSDDCSSVPKEESKYRVQTGDFNTIYSDENGGIPLYFLPQEDGFPVSFLPDGEIVTLTGAQVSSEKAEKALSSEDYPDDPFLWVEVKGDGTVGGWTKLDYLVPADE